MAEAGDGSPVVVIGTDTDILVMLIARATASMNLYMLCNVRPLTLFSIKELQEALGLNKVNLLFIHAVTGCDTTSALYNQGKCKGLKLIQVNNSLFSQIAVFLRPSSTHEEVAIAGEKFLLALYGAGKFDSLNKY